MMKANSSTIRILTIVALTLLTQCDPITQSPTKVLPHALQLSSPESVAAFFEKNEVWLAVPPTDPVALKLKPDGVLATGFCGPCCPEIAGFWKINDDNSMTIRSEEHMAGTECRTLENAGPAGARRQRTLVIRTMTCIFSSPTVCDGEAMVEGFGVVPVNGGLP